jgi:dinuclear metal center YbgI/SA1388 family protein
MDALDEWYPPAGAESWDAVGLVCGVRESQVDRILLAIDAVPAVIDEADSVGAQLLFTHHPLLLTAVHGVPADDPKGGLVHRMICSGIAHFVAHTNAEIATPGVSDALAGALGLTEVSPLEPAPDNPENGVGRVGNLAAELTLTGFTDLVAATLPATSWGVRGAGDPEQVVRRVAVLGGSGSSLIDAARDAGADVYLTADLKHHNGVEAVTQRAGTPMALVDAAHWATERPWLDTVVARLRERFGATVETIASDLVTDPWVLHRASIADDGARSESPATI